MQKTLGRGYYIVTDFINQSECQQRAARNRCGWNCETGNNGAVRFDAGRSSRHPQNAAEKTPVTPNTKTMYFPYLNRLTCWPGSSSNGDLPVGIERRTVHKSSKRARFPPLEEEPEWLT
ncbi:MAG: hypothetical protein U5R30_10315 [Deltaproteobacteria bacterium]|nr:hypothetical protein [Deltaproteobacteria bacterium]